MQRSVEVQIEDVNKGGCALGVLHTLRGGERELLACQLLQKGLCSVVPHSAARSVTNIELTEAEAMARAAEIGIWKGWEAKEAAKLAAEAAAQAAATTNALSVTYKARVSHIEDGGLLWLVRTVSACARACVLGARAFSG